MTDLLGSPGMRGAVGSTDQALQRGMAALNSGLAQEAEQIASQVVRAVPRNVQALYILGAAQVMQGRQKEAIASLTAAARGSNDPRIETLLAVALRQTGQIDDALTWFGRATKRRPPHALAFHELGCLLSSLRRYKEAARAFGGALEIAPTVPEISIQLGSVYLFLRKYPDAKTAFARAVELSPDSPEAQFGFARALQAVGEYETAAGQFRRYLGSRPNEAAARLGLGHCLLKLGELDAGYECFRAAAHGGKDQYGDALGSLVKAARGRFWLKPSAAARFLGETLD